MSQALYRTWRPALWDEVVGQDHIVQTLKNAVAMGRLGHAYLFGGPRGTGKTTSARLLAKAANCLAEDPAERPCNKCDNCLAVNEGRFLDLIEIDAASNTSVDDVRELRDKINFAPSQGKYKVYIIDEVHMLSTSAFNALLKTLEEPPAHVIFILATTEIHKIPATVLSRCQRFEFRRIPVPVIIEKLKELTKKEKIKIDDDALSLIARQATGAMRDAISLVDQLSSIAKKVDLRTAQDLLGTATNQSVIELTQAIIDKDQSMGLAIIQKTLDSGADSRQFARQTVEYLRDLLIIKLGVGNHLELTPEVRETMNKHAESLQTAQLTSIVEDFSKAATDLKTNWHPGLGLELAYARAITWQEALAAPTYASAPASFTPPTYSSPPAMTHDATAFTPKPKAKPGGEKTDLDQASSYSEIKAKLSEIGLNNDSLRAVWDDIKAAIKSRKPLTAALVNSAQAYVVDDKTVVLNFSTELLCNRMTKDDNFRLVKNVINYFFGGDIRVQCTHGQKFTGTLTASEDEGESLASITARQFDGVIIETEDEE